ncbi:MAG: hypothetical protein IJ756_05345 [Paludibacteraceae bacterium]|nr:hypothetical protein [Paludibacteraceae bacterium]
MKKILMVAITLIIAIGTCFSADKYEKRAKQVAKQMQSGKKEPAWQVAPGKQPLDMQLEKSYRMEDETTDDGELKWIIGTATSVGENFDGAKMQATTLAIQEIARLLQTTVAAEIESAGGNKQLEPGEAATAMETTMGGSQWIMNTIGRTIPVVECYQTLPNKNINVRVIIAYNVKTAKERAKKALREELIKQGVEINSRMEKFFDEK